METQNKNPHYVTTKSQNTKEVPRKVAVRDDEIPIRKTCEGSKSEKAIISLSENPNTSKAIGQCEAKHSYSQPQLCSSTKFSREIKKLKSSGTLAKKVQQNVQPQVPKNVLKKINIPFDEEVYKDLINLKVSEEDIGVPRNFPVKSRDVAKNKDPEPVLSDYYKPEFNREYVVKCAPPTYDVEKVWFYDGHGVTNVMKQWESNFEELHFL